MYIFFLTLFHWKIGILIFLLKVQLEATPWAVLLVVSLVRYDDYVIGGSDLVPTVRPATSAQAKG